METEDQETSADTGESGSDQQVAAKHESVIDNDSPVEIHDDRRPRFRTGARRS